MSIVATTVIPRETVWDKRIREIYKAICENGPVTFTDLMDSLKMDQKTLWRYLKPLQGLGIIRKNESTGKYEKFEKWQTFENKEEYLIKLEHSRKVVQNIKFLFPTNYRSFMDLFEDPHFDIANRHLVRHLETGYPEIFCLYEDYEKLFESFKRKFIKFKEEFLNLCKKEGFRTDFDDNGHEAIIKDKKTVPLERFIINLIVQPKPFYVKQEKPSLLNKIFINTFDLKKNHSTSIENELNNLAIRKFGAQKLKRYNDESWSLLRLQHKLIGELGFIHLKVFHGNLLEGICVLCPKVKISVN